eukprot:scaffold6152_cov99-Isochrysis_galbana.AAC.3
MAADCSMGTRIHTPLRPAARISAIAASSCSLKPGWIGPWGRTTMAPEKRASVQLTCCAAAPHKDRPRATSAGSAAVRAQKQPSAIRRARFVSLRRFLVHPKQEEIRFYERYFTQFSLLVLEGDSHQEGPQALRQARGDEQWRPPRTGLTGARSGGATASA